MAFPAASGYYWFDGQVYTGHGNGLSGTIHLRGLVRLVNLTEDRFLMYHQGMGYSEHDVVQGRFSQKLPDPPWEEDIRQ